MLDMLAGEGGVVCAAATRGSTSRDGGDVMALHWGGLNTAQA